MYVAVISSKTQISTMNRAVGVVDSIQAALNFEGTVHANFRGSRSLGRIGFCSFIVGCSLGFHAALTLVCTISLFFEPDVIKGRAVVVKGEYGC